MKLKYPPKIHKKGKNFRGGRKNFSGWPEYIPLYLAHPLSDNSYLFFRLRQSQELQQRGQGAEKQRGQRQGRKGES